MKKITDLAFVTLSIIAILISTGCKKGDVGPAGPIGATGPTGLVVFTVDSFTVQTSQWVITSSGYYKFVHTNSAITQEIVDKGTMNLFVKDYMVDPSWYALPDVVAGGSGYRFSYKLNTVTLYADNFSTGVPRPLIFKEVIMK